jgi:hypothetical protein
MFYLSTLFVPNMAIKGLPGHFLLDFPGRPRYWRSAHRKNGRLVASRRVIHMEGT